MLGLKLIHVSKRGYCRLAHLSWFSEELAPLLLRPKFSEATGWIPCLLMTWLLAAPGHQHPSYRLCKIILSLSSTRKNIIHLHHLSTSKLHKIQNTFLNFLKKNSARQKTFDGHISYVKVLTTTAVPTPINITHMDGYPAENSESIFFQRRSCFTPAWTPPILYAVNVAKAWTLNQIL